jgi:hypothetical protein
VQQRLVHLQTTQKGRRMKKRKSAASRTRGCWQCIHVVRKEERDVMTVCFQHNQPFLVTVLPGAATSCMFVWRCILLLCVQQSYKLHPVASHLCS